MVLQSIAVLFRISNPDTMDWCFGTRECILPVFQFCCKNIFEMSKNIDKISHSLRFNILFAKKVFFLIPEDHSSCYGTMNIVLQSNEFIIVLFRISNAGSKPRFVDGSGVFAPGSRCSWFLNFVLNIFLKCQKN
jgi:hypothetical protein